MISSWVGVIDIIPDFTPKMPGYDLFVFNMNSGHIGHMHSLKNSGKLETMSKTIQR